MLYDLKMICDSIIKSLIDYKKGKMKLLSKSIWRWWVQSHTKHNWSCAPTFNAGHLCGTPDGSYNQVHNATPITRGNKTANYRSSNDWSPLVICLMWNKTAGNTEQNTEPWNKQIRLFFTDSMSQCYEAAHWIQTFQYGLYPLQQIWVRSVNSTETSD